MKEFVDRVALQVVAHFRAYFALDRLFLCLLVALSAMLLELVQRRHDDGFAKRAEMLGDRKRAVDMRDVTVVRLDSIEDLVAVIALHFGEAAFVRNARLATSEFLESK